ncbi:M48 family metalloprotease [bacterium]|nr:M48 family metalloprotease [bacterium]MCI0603791.1 M48 family metalloprotease [bacterium]
MKKVALFLSIQLFLSVPGWPAATQSAPSATPKDFEKGLRVALEATRELGLVEDAEKVKRLNDIAYRVANRAAPEMPHLSFRIVKMEEPNAFALPGGFIFITTGMLDLDLTDEELAALIGHEIIHVKNDHFRRMSKRQTLMNLLYQALVIGIAVGIRDNSGGYDPVTGYERQSNKAEVLQGVAGFGLIFQELLLRGFGRELELEADEAGMRAAAGAGFSPQGASQLFEKMRRKIYEAPGYGYWRTHPYLEDRVGISRVLAATIDLSKNPADPSEYRLKTQENFLEFIKSEKEEQGKTELRRMALNALPKGKRAQELRVWFIQQAEAKEFSKENFFRDYGKLLEVYETNLKEIQQDEPDATLLASLKQNIEKMKKEKETVLSLYEEVLAKQAFDTQMLERFLSNFPDNSRVPEVQFQLAENYRILNKSSQAVELHLKLLEKDSQWKNKAKERLQQLIPRLEDLASSHKLSTQTKDAAIAKLASERMKSIASSFKTLQNGYEFRRSFPGSQLDKEVVKRMNVLAEDALKQGKLYQAVGEYQKALDQYSMILRYGSDLPVADQVRDTLVDFQELKSVRG